MEKSEDAKNIADTLIEKSNSIADSAQHAVSGILTLHSIL